MNFPFFNSFPMITRWYRLYKSGTIVIIPLTIDISCINHSKLFVIGKPWSIDWFKGKNAGKSHDLHGNIWLVSGEDLPLVVNPLKLWKITIVNGKSHYKWSFSIAMSNCWRVHGKIRGEDSSSICEDFTVCELRNISSCAATESVGRSSKRRRGAAEQYGSWWNDFMGKCPKKTRRSLVCSWF